MNPLKLLSASLPTCLVSLAWCCVFVRATTPQTTDQSQLLVIRQDTELDPSKQYGQIIVETSGVTVDGRGAWLIGSGGTEPKSFQKTAIVVKNASGVTIKNVNAKGWETGLRLEHASSCTIQDCNFSDNFHDPKFGWGENGHRGGLVLDHARDCKLLRNKANRVWDACVLLHSDRNTLEANDFSHTSNTCLHLWNSSGNTVRENNLSYGIRIDPGEVHARDSAGVLIESGSNDNTLTKNNCTHGGDGIFIRVLNNWVSTGNVFTENDCSYANNNCIEAWSPRNSWIRNQANYGSYGFWLGASDQNELIENEASYNGTEPGHRNSPHLPDKGHAGIVFMFGPSSHTILRQNICRGNNGAGIAAIGDQPSKGKKWKAFHWIIDQNTCEDNRWGIYLQHAELLDISSNTLRNNKLGDILEVENVRDMQIHQLQSGATSKPPVIKLNGPSYGIVGQALTWNTTGSLDPQQAPLSFRWRIVPGQADRNEVWSGSDSSFAHTFNQAGFYRLAVTANNGSLSDLAWRDIYIVEESDELGTEGNSKQWSWRDSDSKVLFHDDAENRLLGKYSLRANIAPYSGGRVTLRWSTQAQNISTTDKSQLVFWIKTQNENVPAWQDANPLIKLEGEGVQSLLLTPAADFLSQPPYNEAREGWSQFVVPLAGNEKWKSTGDRITQCRAIELGFDSWGAPPLKIWLDGLSIK